MLEVFADKLMLFDGFMAKNNILLPFTKLLVLNQPLNVRLLYVLQLSDANDKVLLVRNKILFLPSLNAYIALEVFNGILEALSNESNA